MTDHDNAYDELVEADDDAHWAFGTGFDDPLAGVDTAGARPASTRADLAAYCLMLGDDALVLAQRLSEWMHATRRSSRRRSRSPTSRSTCSARRGCCWPAPRRPTPTSSRAPDGRRPADDALAYFRDAEAFRNVRWSSGRTATSPRDRPAAAVLGLAAGAAGAAARLARPGARRGGRQGRQGGGLPPRPRRALGGHARRRHRRVAPPDAGRARRRLAGRRRALPHVTKSSAGCRGRRRSGAACDGDGRRRRWTRCSPPPR